MIIIIISMTGCIPGSLNFDKYHDPIKNVIERKHEKLVGISEGCFIFDFAS